MESFSSYLDRYFTRSILIANLLTLLVLLIITLTWGYFSTSNKLNDDLSVSSKILTSLIYDKNWDLINTYSNGLQKANTVDYIKVLSRKDDFVFYESKEIESSSLLHVCRSNSSSDIVKVSGCLKILSPEIFFTFISGLGLYSLVLLIVFFFSKRKFQNVISTMENSLVSALDESNSSSSSGIAEIDRIKSLLKSKTEDLLFISEKVARAEFSRRVIHDLRSPLAILTDFFSRNERHDTVVVSAVKDIKLLSSELLEKTRGSIELQSMRRIDVFKMISEIVQSKRIEYSDRNVMIELGSFSERVILLVNELDFKRVMSNLINNAIESNSAPVVEIKLRQDFDSFSLEIEDNGPGFSEVVLKAIRERKIITSKKDGNGIGLFSAIETLSSMGYELKFDQKEKGAIVSCCIPFSRNYASIPLVLIDNDKYVRASWIRQAEVCNIKLLTYDSYLSFKENVSLLPKSAEVFIDSYLGEGQFGEDYLPLLQELGFFNLNLATGRAIDEFQIHKNLKLLNSISGKEFPYKIRFNS